MTAPRPVQALLARLVDEAAIESEPIEEIRADLAVFGIDPGGSIRLARRLAAGAASPADELLDRIAESESLDDELRRLEQADIAQVRGQLPSGDAATAIAHAHRASGRAANVVGLRRRRSRRLTYGLSGMAAALAASLVLYVGLSQHRQEFSRFDLGPSAPSQPASESLQAQAKPAATEADKVLSKQSTSENSLQPATVPAAPAAVAEAEAPVPTSSRLASDDVQARMAPAASAPEPLAERRASDNGTSESKGLETASGIAAAREATDAANSPEQSVAEQFAKSFEREEPNLVVGGGGEWDFDRLRGDMSANVIAPAFGIDRPVVALLVIDSTLIPAGLSQDQYPVGGLAARMMDARELAAGRPIVALVTYRFEDGTRDAVVLRNDLREQSRDAQEFAIATDEPDAASPPAVYKVELLDRR